MSLICLSSTAPAARASRAILSIVGQFARRYFCACTFVGNVVCKMQSEFSLRPVRCPCAGSLPVSDSPYMGMPAANATVRSGCGICAGDWRWTDQEEAYEFDEELTCKVDDVVQRSRLREHVPGFSQQLLTRWHAGQTQIGTMLQQEKRVSRRRFGLADRRWDSPRDVFGIETTGELLAVHLMTRDPKRCSLRRTCVGGALKPRTIRTRQTTRT